jgi:hypothetical protein
MKLTTFAAAAASPSWAARPMRNRRGPTRDRCRPPDQATPAGRHVRATRAAPDVTTEPERVDHPGRHPRDGPAETPASFST